MIIRNSIDIEKECEKHQVDMAKLALIYEHQLNDHPIEAIKEHMLVQWTTMKEAIHQSMDTTSPLRGGKIIQREGYKLLSDDFETSLLGPVLKKAIAYSLGTMEVNISMGLIVAAPTAGASGILPGSLLAYQEATNASDEVITDGLLVASLIGLVIAKQATISGAKGGCQAEVGSAAAMAAGTLTYLKGGSIKAIFDSAAIALNNLMGLICDPVAGLVEVPCHKRNAMGSANAFICSEMVMAGIPSVIPFDEVVVTMKQVGDLMPACHRETGTGGIAISPTGLKLKKEIMEGD